MCMSCDPSNMNLLYEDNWKRIQLYMHVHWRVVYNSEIMGQKSKCPQKMKYVSKVFTSIQWSIDKDNYMDLYLSTNGF